MGKCYDEIDDRLAAFVRQQHVFFVATAPSGRDGHVNVSPKGGHTFHVLGPRRVLYVDFVGSGIETIAHLRENGRITVLFTAFEGPPRIVRLHGRGRAIEPVDPEFVVHHALLPPRGSVRSLIVVDVERISDSCGFGVPLYEYRGERTQLLEWAEQRGAGGILEYQRTRNRISIDDLPGLAWVAADDARTRR